MCTSEVSFEKGLTGDTDFNNNDNNNNNTNNNNNNNNNNKIFNL